MPKPTVTLVGPGSLGSALAQALHQAGYRLDEIVARPASLSRAKQLARRTGARAAPLEGAALRGDVIWLCVPDDAIAACARSLAPRISWKGRIALHSSGALPSDQLAALRRRGAAVASLHPMMTFVRGAAGRMQGVTFAVEGDPAAVRLARRIARDLGGEVISIKKESKPLYHALGSFASPLVIATLAAGEELATAVGLPKPAARRAIAPILRQTIENYLRHGPAEAFSGPITRGDLATVRRHLRALRRLPAARAVYVALVGSALQTLPVRNRAQLKKILKDSR